MSGGSVRGPPALVLWYSGGFTREEGVKTLEVLQKALRKAGVADQLVLDHSNEYGFTGEGHGPWPSYVDKLVELIDERFAGRPLILLGHSKGTCPAMSVATRLGARVLKAYSVACASWLPGRQTPWEKLSKGFKARGDQGLLEWFASLNPGNLLLETVAYAPEDQFDELVEASPFLKSKLQLMKLQYRDAMYPDMGKGEVAPFPAELCAVSPALDGGSQPGDLLGFRKFSERFEIWQFVAGHADILSNADFLGRLAEDMLRFFGDGPPAAVERPAFQPELWLRPVPMPRAEPPRAPPALTPAAAPKPNLSAAELREIFTLLNARAGKDTPAEVPELPGQERAGGAGAVYSVKVQLGPGAAPAARRDRRGGRGARGHDGGRGAPTEDAAALVQAVTVDAERGPLLELPDGSSRFLVEVPSYVRLADGAPQYGPRAPSWAEMQSTDQKVLLAFAAKLNRQARERAGRGAAGAALPDFLAGFEPRGKETEASFWQHFRVRAEGEGE